MSKVASKNQRRQIHELAATRGMQPSLRLARMTRDEAKRELARIRSFPQRFASERQRQLLRNMARERGIPLDLPKRLDVGQVDVEMKRLRKFPKKPKGR